MLLVIKQKFYQPFIHQRATLKLIIHSNTPKEIADLITAKWEIGMPGGVLITNPIPTGI